VDARDLGSLPSTARSSIYFNTTPPPRSTGRRQLLLLHLGERANIASNCSADIVFSIFHRASWSQCWWRFRAIIACWRSFATPMLAITILTRIRSGDSRRTLLKGDFFLRRHRSPQRLINANRPADLNASRRVRLQAGRNRDPPGFFVRSRGPSGGNPCARARIETSAGRFSS